MLKKWLTLTSSLIGKKKTMLPICPKHETKVKEWHVKLFIWLFHQICEMTGNALPVKKILKENSYCPSDLLSITLANNRRFFFISKYF